MLVRALMLSLAKGGLTFVQHILQNMVFHVPVPLQLELIVYLILSSILNKNYQG